MMVHSPMRYAVEAVTITTIAFVLVAAERLIIIPTAVVAFTPPPRTSSFRLIHADVSTYQHHRHPLNNVLLLLKRRDAIIKYSNNRAVNSEDDAFRKRTKLTAAAANSNSDNNKEGSEEKEEEEEEEGVRLNKVFKATHSRRSADKLIEEGRVTINGRRVHDKGGYKVIPYRDVITLDGKVVTGWEQINAIAPTNNKNHRQQKQQRNDQQQLQQQHEDEYDLQTSSFEYVKYYKPLGVTCTTDLRIKDNIIHSIERYGYNSRHRVYPIGRLDKETSGLILLTSDGRIVNSVLRGERKQPKVYKVKVDGLLDDTHLQRLRDGIVIRTVAQRKNKSLEENTLIAKTKPCKVQRIGPSAVQMTLVEGRNRQIRKMMEAIGFTVVRLHRVEFMGIKLSRGLEVPGDWDYLDNDEMELVKAALRSDNNKVLLY